MNLDCVVNGGSSIQQPQGMYYQLKDLIEHFTVRRVVIGVTSDQLIGSHISTQGNLIVCDRLSLKNKLMLAKETLPGQNILYLLNCYRYRDNITDIQKISEKKQRVRDNNYVDNSSRKEYYADTGFVYSKESIPTGNVPYKIGTTFKTDRVNDRKLFFLEECIRLCQENNIPVALVSGMTTVMRMQIIKGYQDAVDYYQELADRYGIPYYNLNYLKGREEFLPDEMMMDYNHTNGEGAEIVSSMFADILNKADRGEDVSDLFYEDLDDFEKDVHRVSGLGVEIKENKKANTAHVVINSTQNKDVRPEYRIEISVDDGDYEEISGWGEETERDLSLPEGGKRTLRVTARLDEADEKPAWQVCSLSAR